MNAVGIVILFDRRGDHAGHADAVAAHEHGQRLALLIEHAGMHRLAVELPELEDVADLDAARDLAACRGRSGSDRRVCTLRMSTECGSGRSRPQFTPVKCMSFSLAPQTKSAR